jgi:hypothetical protein
MRENNTVVYRGKKGDMDRKAEKRRLCGFFIQAASYVY